MNRLLGVMLALVFAVSAATAGRGIRCEMAVHCAGCPSEALAWTSALDCPMVFPGSPDSLDAEQVVRVPVDAVPLVVVRPVRPVAIARSSAESHVWAAAPEPSPPGLEVLRV